MKISALLPVKSFRNAKQRLSPVLGLAQREMLAELMFRDVLRQTVQARGLAGTFVVTADDKVTEIALSSGASVIREPAEKGETDAVEFARLELKKTGYQAVLIIPGDMPLVRSQDIEQILQQAPEAEGVMPPFALLVPSHDRMGTNALLLAPPDVIKLRFGYDSFGYHMSQVSAVGLTPRFFENERIALDIDEPKDLERFLASGCVANEAYEVAKKMVADQEAHRLRRSGGL
jgi:2-phospho-L-lactate guanylyltransferase